MTEDIQWKLTAYCMEKADECIRRGDFENIMEGLDWFAASIEIIPPSGLKAIMPIINEQMKRDTEKRLEERA
ncbi:MAG: hypothetical protein LIO53_00255 [Oscillospiraceae bacterium]|nr:hypothetical protein [Oscillospiraceae bacterium]